MLFLGFLLLVVSGLTVAVSLITKASRMADAPMVAQQRRVDPTLVAVVIAGALFLTGAVVLLTQTSNRAEQTLTPASQGP